MTPALHIGPVFGAVIRLSLDRTSITKQVQTPAVDAAQAQERIDALMREVWPGWQMRHVVRPQKLGGGQ